MWQIFLNLNSYSDISDKLYPLQNVWFSQKIYSRVIREPNSYILILEATYLTEDTKNCDLLFTILS